jgi:hypothetical protein
MRRLCVNFMLAVVCIGAAWRLSGRVEVVEATAVAAVPQGALTILDNANTYWRWCKASRAPIVIADGAGQAEVEMLGGRKIDVQEARRLSPNLPGALEWAGPEFNDGTWPRTSGGLLRDVAFAFVARSSNTAKTIFPNGGTTALVRLRGRFNVTDPNTVKGLYLTMKFRGGVVAYLNGQEVARGGMGAGPIGRLDQSHCRCRCCARGATCWR